MKITKHGDYLFQLTRFWAFNCYLIKENDGLTLIDTNLKGSANQIMQAARQIGQPIKRIALTHAHMDHAASLDALAALLPDAEVCLGERTAEFLNGDLSLKPNEPEAKLRGDYITCTTKPTQLLSPGDQLGSLRVIAAPGHTPDQIAYFDERDGTLIAGDAFQTAAGTAVAGIRRWLFPFPAMATWHLPTAVRTATALTRLQPSQLAVGHGRVLEEPYEAMQTAVEEAEKKIHAQAQIA